MFFSLFFCGLFLSQVHDCLYYFLITNKKINNVQVLKKTFHAIINDKNVKYIVICDPGPQNQS